MGALRVSASVRRAGSVFLLGLPQSPPRALSVIERLSARRALSNVYSRTDWQTSWAFWDRLWPQSTMVSPQLSHVPEFNLSQNWKYLLHSYVCVVHCVHSCKGIIHCLHVSNIMSEKAEPRWSIFAKEFCNAQFYQTLWASGQVDGWVSIMVNGHTWGTFCTTDYSYISTCMYQWYIT